MADALKPDCSPAFGGQARRRREFAASPLGRTALLLILALLGGVGANPCWGEQKPKAKLLFLVARRPIVDPRSRAADAGASVAGASADPDYPRSAGLLGRARGRRRAPICAAAILAMPGRKTRRARRRPTGPSQRGRDAALPRRRNSDRLARCESPERPLDRRPAQGRHLLSVRRHGARRFRFGARRSVQRDAAARNADRQQQVVDRRRGAQRRGAAGARARLRPPPVSRQRHDVSAHDAASAARPSRADRRRDLRQARGAVRAARRRRSSRIRRPTRAA